MNSAERRTLAAALMLQIAAALPVFLVGALASHLRVDLEISAQSIGAAVSAFYGSSALAAYPLGRVCDVIGWHRAVRIATAGLVACLVLTGLVANAVWHLVALLALAGLCHSLASSAAAVAIAQGTPERHHGVLFGIKQSAIPVATMMAGLSIPLIAERLGHRPAFVLAATLPALAFLVGRGGDAGSPRAAPDHGVLDVSAPDAGRDADRSRVIGRPEVARARANTSRSRAFVARLDSRLTVLMLSCAMGSAGTSALSAFFVVSAVDHGITASKAGVTLAVASSLSIAVRIVGGWVADRTRSSGFLQAAVLLLVGTVGYALLATGSARLLVLAALLAYGAGWGWPGLVHFGAVRYRPSAPGTVTGVIRTGTAGGATLGPLAFGILSVWAGYGVAWTAVAAWAAIAGTSMLLARPRLSAAVTDTRT